MKTKTGKDFRKFSESEIKKQGIHFSKYVIYINKINTDKIIMPDKLPCTKMVQMHKHNVSYTVMHIVSKIEQLCKTFLTMLRPCLLINEKILEYGAKLKIL